MPEGANLATIIVALVGFLGMYITHRISAKASTQNARTVAEVEAFARAVKMDRDTIKRQDEELEDLTKQLKDIRNERRVWIIESAAKDQKIEALVRQNVQLRKELREKNSGQENVRRTEVHGTDSAATD